MANAWGDSWGTAWADSWYIDETAPVASTGLREITTGLFGKMSSTVSLTGGSGLKEITTGLFTEKFLE